MRWIGRVSLVALAAAAVISGGVAGASAGTVRKAIHASPAANEPSGYAIVTNMITVNGNTRGGGSVACPAKDVVFGGGALIISDNLHAEINSSWPKNSQTWAVNVNNGDPAPSNVTIYAVCAHKPTGYQQVKTPTATNAAGALTTQIADCPTGKKVLGGGGHSSSASLAVAETSSLPGKTAAPVHFAWGVTDSNQSAANAKIFTVAICAKPAGYKLINGSFVTDSAGTLQQALVSCPSGTAALGGGVSAAATVTGVDINTTEPTNTGWIAYEANSTGSDVQIRAAVACAS